MREKESDDGFSVSPSPITQCSAAQCSCSCSCSSPPVRVLVHLTCLSVCCDTSQHSSVRACSPSPSQFRSVCLEKLACVFLSWERRLLERCLTFSHCTTVRHGGVQYFSFLSSGPDDWSTSHPFPRLGKQALLGSQECSRSRLDGWMDGWTDGRCRRAERSGAGLLALLSPHLAWLCSAYSVQLDLASGRIHGHSQRSPARTGCLPFVGLQGESHPVACLSYTVHGNISTATQGLAQPRPRAATSHNKDPSHHVASLPKCGSVSVSLQQGRGAAQRSVNLDSGWPDPTRPILENERKANFPLISATRRAFRVNKRSSSLQAGGRMERMAV